VLQHFWGTGTFFQSTRYTKNTLPNVKIFKSILSIYNMAHVVDRKNGLVFFFKKCIVSKETKWRGVLSCVLNKINLQRAPAAGITAKSSTTTTTINI
jgi:hypothetical protein